MRSSLFVSTLISAALVLGGSVAAFADEVKAGDLVIADAWSRATPNGAKVASGYLTIENKGSAPDRLVGVSTDAAARGEVHEMKTENGVMTMRPIEGGLEIKPGKTVTLAPGGYHLMFIGPKAPFKQGTKISVTLQFDKAGKVTVPFEVRGIGAQGPGGAMHQMAPGHKM